MRPGWEYCGEYPPKDPLWASIHWPQTKRRVGSFLLRANVVANRNEHQDRFEWEVKRSVQPLPDSTHGSNGTFYDANFCENPSESEPTLEDAQRHAEEWLIKFLRHEIEVFEATICMVMHAPVAESQEVAP